MKYPLALLLFVLAVAVGAGWVTPPGGLPADPDDAWSKDVRTVSVSSSGGASQSYRYLVLSAGASYGVFHPDYETVLFVNSATNVETFGSYAPFYGPALPQDVSRTNLCLEYRAIVGSYAGPPYSFDVWQRHPEGTAVLSNLLCTVAVDGSGGGDVFHGYRFGPPSMLVLTNASGNLQFIWPYFGSRSATGTFGFAWRYRWQ